MHGTVICFFKRLSFSLPFLSLSPSVWVAAHTRTHHTHTWISMLSNSITNIRWDPLLFTTTQGALSHNGQSNNFWIIVLQIWRASCFQITDSKLWQILCHYEILLMVLWREQHTVCSLRCSKRNCRGESGGRLVSWKITNLRIRRWGAGSGSTTNQMCNLRWVLGPLWDSGSSGHYRTWQGDHPALFQLKQV